MMKAIFATTTPPRRSVAFRYTYPRDPDDNHLVPRRAARDQARGTLVRPRGRARAPSLEPRQGLLARRGLYEGRPPHVLLQRLADHAAPSPRAPVDSQEDAQRDQQPLLLRKERADPYSVVDADYPRALRGQGDPLPIGRRCDAHALGSQSRLYRVPPAARARTRAVEA